MGEIMFRGNIAMKGYLKNPKATSEAFAGGWFHTGDLAVLDPDGYVKIKDRSKDIIISGGENISSIEVEDVLYRHPAVLVAAVVAKPDEKWGETPCAFVELRSGATVTAEEIIAHCKTQLAGFKVPRDVVFGELPKTSTGKIQKFELRKRVDQAA
jgi:fatty-acyl-CoA synthase